MHVTHYPRWQEPLICHALKTRRVLVLAGARQCGKTTLARQIAGQTAIYRSLDDVTLLAAALSDPQGFVRHADELMVIDEVQKALLLLPAIKQDVDSNTRAGRFLLTGSANIQALPAVAESLAGRVRTIRLRPLAQGELRGTKPIFLQNAFAEVFLPDPEHQATPDYSLKDQYLLLALRGGYPEVLQQLDAREARRWLQDYLHALLDRDLRDIANIRRRDSMAVLLEVIAAWSSKFIDITAIGAGLGLARPTLQAYVNALETLYLVERVRPWLKTDYERVSKQDKLFMTDTGLMAAILRWQFPQVRFDGEKNGKLLETWVFNQLAALCEAQLEDYQLYHYRDREQREVDFIVENEMGDLLGIEVKAGSVLNQDSFKHLRWFREHMARGRHFVGIVLYTGEHLLPFGAGLWAVPMSALWG